MSSSSTPRWGSNITAAGNKTGYVPPVSEPTPVAPSQPEEPGGPDPSLFVQTRYTRYSENGSIHSHGVMGLGILMQLKITEGRILIGIEGDPDTEWVDDEDGQPTLEKRPVLDIPSEITAARGVEAVIPSLPACRITFRGPMSGAYNHEGGEVRIGFSIPGTYTLSMDPFPYQRVGLTMEVTK